MMVSYIRAIAKAAPSYLTPAFWHEDFLPSRSRISSDAIAGVTVAVVLIPQAMAYALLLGLPPINGLYAAFFGVLIGALWGSSREMITGPVGVMSLLAVAALVPYAGSSPEQMIVLAAALAVMVGLVQLALGLFRLGFIMRLVPQSVLAGFSVGAAVVIAVTQLPALLGIAPAQHPFVFQSIADILRNLANANIPTVMIGLISIAGIVLLKRFGHAFPAALTVIAIATAASWALDLPSNGVSVIGAIPVAFPSLMRLGAGDLLHFGSTAIVMALIGFMGSFAVAKSLAAETKQKLDINRELVGQGLANIASGLFRGYPVSGSFSISALNRDAGARSALAAVIAALCVVLAILAFTPLLYFLPKATLAAVVFVSIIGLLRIEPLRHLYQISPTDGIIAFMTFAAAFILQPQDAVLIGVVVSLLLFIRSVMQVEVVEVGMHRTWQALRSIAHNETVDVYPHVLIVRIDRAFVYANAERIVEEVHARVSERRERTSEPLRALVLNLSGVNGIDSSGIEGMEELAHMARAQQMRFVLINAKHTLRDALARAGLGDRITYLHDYDELVRFAKAFG